MYISEAILMIALRRDNTCNIRQKEGISMKTIRIGGGQGFWGDLIDAPIIMAKEDNVDYICCDYLAELTLSIMRRQQEKRPEAGYARDFITSLKGMLPYLAEKKTKVITNAGGMNVKACVEKVKEVVKAGGYNLKVGYVLGDDVREKIPQLREQGVQMQHMDTGEDIDGILPKMVNANRRHPAEDGQRQRLLRRRAYRQMPGRRRGHHHPGPLDRYGYV